MNPVAFQLFGISVHWYGIILSFAVIVGLVLAIFEAKRVNFNPEDVVDLVIWALPISILGARFYYVFFNWGFYQRTPGEILAIWHGGLAIHGAVISALITTWVFVKYRQLNFWKTVDIFAPGLILGQAIGRWGNFINQEAYGYETDLPWAMYIDGAYRHPTFLYESLWNFSVFLFLLWLRKKPKLVSGDIFLAYSGLYSLGRFFIEGLRTDSLMLGNIRVAQLVSAVAIFLSVILIYSNHRKQRENEEFTDNLG
ncbi:Prolipoprotein diacylglyceryl transferase [Koleobacter methoxysyntrophicus]|uniref:Phosphatidylglycerol--prolipoprotein diacylglyceryl transferase n=1 Tax=Koleobacter methoxysyntrophicus TaxID=2751313 RepID=A0A8A0RQQ4_9FIRM|nr:prolipoprotein diacylglyceryl transferase [Koleobacter methoxysyntrophicus]MDK2901922.1 phosphatidylglycerol---prolipoprotein diacylglyceryl transferase [Thermosediminibacterales bacterium]NPV44965.1 prolipoprotein diacylglyceryl transferase [Bacillota bacterium]QSQ09727.1 Prolipoprotein diacylglyceryl transferase [Koleobacter methoxysyntrophicus]